MKKIKTVALVEIFIITILMMDLKGCYNTVSCDEQRSFIEQNYSGLVSKKYIDSNNHNYKVVNIKGMSDPIIFFVDNSGFFSFVKPGDFVEKDKKSKFLNVIRGKTRTKFKINFFCNE